MAIGDDLDFRSLLHRLDAPVTEFDCGQLCAPTNGGIPVCCDAESTVPVLYKKELAHLMASSDMWRRWRPRCAADREMSEEMGEWALGECRGAAHCQREWRSLNCRTFPFMPYLDHDGIVQGIVFDETAAAGKCPLVNLPGVITRRYIREAIDFWTELIRNETHERDFYLAESRRLRRRQGRLGEPVSVLSEGGILQFPTRKADWIAMKRGGGSPSLIPMNRPEG